MILTSAGVVASVASNWVHRTLFDTDAFMETVGPLGTTDAVTGALSDKFSSTLIEWIDAENRLRDLLPPVLAPVAGRIGDRVDEYVTEETDQFFQSEVYESAWLRLARSSHVAAVAIIQDQLPFGSSEGGEVTVDLIPVMTPIVDRVFARLIELTDAIPQVILDQVDFDETLADVVDTYETEGLPDWLGEIMVYSSDRLAVMQEATALLDRLVWVLPVVTLLLAIAALYYAPLRGRTAVIMLGAAGVAWLLALLLVNGLVRTVVANVESTTAATIADEVFTHVTSGLNQILLFLGLLAVVAALGVGGWLYFTKEREGESNPEVV